MDPFQELEQRINDEFERLKRNGKKQGGEKGNKQSREKGNKQSREKGNKQGEQEIKDRSKAPDAVQLRSILIDALKPGLKEVDPLNLVKNSIKISNNQIGFISPLGVSNSDHANTLEIAIERSSFDEIIVVGGGKATGFMAHAIMDRIPKSIPIKGLINIPYGQEFGNAILPKFRGSENLSRKIEVNYASHPLPDENGVNGVSKMMDLIKNCSKNALIIVLISGGGSSLMPYPKESITLADLQTINQLLLNCGASINEINAVRKHLSDFKGGNLARRIYPKRAISLIISDVMGDYLDVIASGPTYPDSTTFQDVRNILTKYELLDSIPKSIKDMINKGVSGEIADTPKSDDACFTSVSNLLIGSVELIKNAVKKGLENKGFKDIAILGGDVSLNLPPMLGEAADYAKNIISNLVSYLKIRTLKQEIKENKFYDITSGEFTVTIRGNGKGGRNQEMLLSFIHNFLQLDPQTQNKLLNELDFCIISMAFDGIEGNSPAAGAIVDNFTIKEVKRLDLNALDYLRTNNSYEFFDKIGDCIRTGQTGTNVNDCCALLIRNKN